MALSKRLFSIFSMVEKGSIAADIGCDHGLLSIALSQEEICSHVYACDLRKGPLERAKEAILEAGLEKQITTVLCNGLDGIQDDIDTIIIAGMGFDTIKGILERGMDKLHEKRIIIQCNKHVDELRRWISEHGYTILMEDIVEEDHFYEILCFTIQKGKQLSEDEILFGLHQNHPLFTKYWLHRLEIIDKVLNQMPESEHSYKNFEILRKRIFTTLKRHDIPKAAIFEKGTMSEEEINKASEEFRKQLKKLGST